jgi:16S rRNA (uracil1498-N3)-methyltransferase
MARFLLPPEAWRTDAVLSGDEAKHASQVLRVRRGDSVTVFDGRGRSARAEIVEVSRNEIRLKLGEERSHPPATPLITLAQAITKGKTMDLIVQKAVELGVSTIQPLLTRHAVVQLDDEDAGKKTAKWQRVAVEACKQCGQDLVPEVATVAEFLPWLQSATNGLRLIASLAEGARPLREVLRGGDQPEHVTLLIGPEGDFSEKETQQALAAGFVPVSFGDIVLRAETAAFFAVAAVRYEFPESCGPSADT